MSTEIENAVTELAHVARNLLTRLAEIDTELPGSMREALSSKIEFYAQTAQHTQPVDDEPELRHAIKQNMTELERRTRRRTVKGWALRDLTAQENAAIKWFLAGGPVPAGYERRYKLEQEIAAR